MKPRPVFKSIHARPDPRIRCRRTLALAAATIAALRVAPAQAHAFGTRYDLPLPLDFYLIGAGAAVALSFVIVALFFRTRHGRAAPLRIDLLRYGPMRHLAHPALTGVLGEVSVALFVLVLATGFFGAPDTLDNFAPTFVWVIWWVGLAYVVSLVGNIWPVINPWSIVFEWLEKIVCHLRRRARLEPRIAYPVRLGVWPAVALFGLFAWLELVSEAAETPRTLATLILVYSAITWVGMAAFGRDVWLARGEAFSLAFGVLGRFAPIGGPAEDSGDGGPRGWHLRPYAGGLVVERPRPPSMTVFVLLMLATVTYDGFKETPLWAGMLEWIASRPAVHPLILKLHELGLDFIVVFKTVVLALFPLVFFLVYQGFSWLAKDVSGSGLPVAKIAGLFVFSLVPIAIAYHLAHYLSYLLIAGQYIIPLASDPFGAGWDLFGTAGYEARIGIVGARFVWYTAVIAIVVGHVIAVGVGHLVALRAFETPRAALKSQYPFLFLMVAYTMVSLWILSQPVVATPGMVYRAAPADTVTLTPFGFREYCLELAPRQEIRYAFNAERPIEFNIHYHEGLTVRYPVRILQVASLEDGFAAEGGSRTYCVMWTNKSAAETVLTYRVTGQ